MQKKASILFVISFFSVFSFCQNIDVQHYKFYIDLNDKEDFINAGTEIDIKFLKPTHSFSLDLAQQMVIEVISDIAWENKINDDNVSLQRDGEKLIITLRDTAKTGESRKFRIAYTGSPKDGLIISRNKYGDKTFFSDNWPNRAHYWIPCNDRPDDKASFEFVVTAPSQYTVISNGIKIEEKNLGNGKTLTHWKEDTPLPTKVMVIGVAKFAVKTFDDSPPNIPVSAWVYQQDSVKGFHDYAPASEILKFFSNYIAPYPYEKLANVQSKTIFGGMENASAIFYFENSVTGKGGVEDLLAHEIAHQWFGDMASEKSFAHLWLSEGFASYLTDIYWQHKYGDEAFKKRLQREREEVIGFVKTNNHPVVDSLSPFMDLLNANSYQKGAWVLHMLRNEVGDSVFHKIIQTYYQRYKGSNADTKDFEAVAEKVSEKDLKWFFDQWLYQPGIPVLRIQKTISSKGVQIRIEQFQKKLFQFTLPIAVEPSYTKEKVGYFKISKQSETFFLSQDKAARITIDPDVTLLYQEVK